MILGAKADYIQELCCFLSIGCRILHSGVSAAHAALARAVSPPPRTTFHGTLSQTPLHATVHLLIFFNCFLVLKISFSGLIGSSHLQVESYLFVCVITLTCVLFPTMEGVK